MTARTPLGRLVFFLDYDDGGGGRRFANSPGLLPMLGHLRRVGADVTFVSSEEGLFGTIEAGCDWVGISSMERMLPQSVAIARRVRETQPGLVLLLGGSSIDRVACQLAADVVDVVVLGESELILPAVLAALAGADTLVRAVDDRTRPTVAGPAHPGGALSPDQVDRLLAAGFVRRGPDGPVTVPATGIFVRDPAHGVVWQRPKPESAPVLVATARRGDRAARGALQDTAPLDHELDGLFDVPWDEFATQGWTVFELYAQRGCRWGRCEFCSVADRNVRALSPRKVAETIRAAVDRGISTISFADDLFVQHAAWNDELLRLLADPPIAELELRAQTMANKTVWPHLEAMAGVGFKELAFGLETFVPRRAELWRKSLRGHSYVTQGKETILRTAAAGILPVIYLIVVDPTSTLPEVAGELADCVEFLRLVYRQTGIVPRLSSSMSLLPVADVPVTERYEYSVRRVPTRHGEIVLPDEFRLPPPLARLVTEVDAATADLPYRRDNLDAFDAYFASLAAGAAADGPAVAGEVDLHVARGRAALSSLRAELEVLAEHLAQQLVSGRMRPGADLWSDYRRFGSYVAGVSKLVAALGSPERLVASS